MGESLLPGARRIRIVVERADRPRCGIRVGDHCDVDGTGLSTGGRPFCPQALMGVLPVLGMRQSPIDLASWLVRKPYLCCPDAEENVVLKLEVLE
ncbi:MULTISPECIES: TIGR04076 family protein [unclassified Micromonospora]|uniref:TIGR04076 family protein n=1 Tax=unclassified Micromonospora TaxID=2617518 RepID=UPI003643DB0F